MRQDDPIDRASAPASAAVPAPAHPGPIGRILVAWTELCLRAGWTIVTVAVVTAALSGVWTARYLGY